jgi:hypothetical protein
MRALFLFLGGALVEFERKRECAPELPGSH